MIRFMLRLIGFLVLAAGFVALIVDGTRSIASGALTVTDAATSWAAASPETLEKTKAFVGQSGDGGEASLATVLAQPTFLVLGVIGLVLMLIGRRRRRARVGAAP